MDDLEMNKKKEHVNPGREFWEDKRVLITGNTGFKGSWISLYLHTLGAKVFGYSLDPPTNPNIYTLCRIDELTETVHGDIRDLAAFKNNLERIKPEVVFHFAAQALVREAYANPIQTYETNVLGTANILEAVRNVDSVKAVIIATTDKVYQNKEWFWAYRECDSLGGVDPYSSSKACAELVIAAYRKSFFSQHMGSSFTGIASVRAGNVIGGGDWAKDRIIPDFFRSLSENKPLIIRSPDSIRPWQHVFEPLRGYLLVAELMENTPESDLHECWNFGSDENDHKPVKWIIDYLYERMACQKNYRIVSDGPHEATYLRLDSSKAKNLLNWHPKYNLTKTLDNIVEWTSACNDNEDMQTVSLRMIKNYHEL
ncbi:MAG: CDP-glucose 4,6-dehydratase [Methanospirillum sp.]|uniref:CDP-glucose 4,6-dehydratase n=1 Tax=Methanospirillum sp. TaxID=45200 RepID=UPI002372C948|nr:CDP-glucose 4,6-dehydratase [Methanospirillum sp.]MDD1729892.1 CDP-glucose 4,6-dehydratase [Methanospirillum sp.]